MRNNSLLFSIKISLFVFLISACANKKKITYFQGDKSIASDSTLKYSPLYKPDDLLNITVMALEADAVQPFNLSSYGNLNTDKNPGASTTQKSRGYLLDQNGEIEFPVIGKIKLSGLNRTQASDLIRSKLTEYVKDPTVQIELLNFKITVLGDVSKPGTYLIPNERLTLLEAIGMAGDLNITGKRKNVLVIRDANGQKKETRVDLTSKDVFNSPVFYLQQNDLIYVEPNQPKKNTSAINPTAITLILSITTLGVTLLTLLTR